MKVKAKTNNKLTKLTTWENPTQQCKVCNEIKPAGVQYEVDHIKPLSKGGAHHPDNLQIITAEENRKKAAKYEV